MYIYRDSISRVYANIRHFIQPIVAYLIGLKFLLVCPGFDSKPSEKKYFTKSQEYYYGQKGTQNISYISRCSDFLHYLLIIHFIVLRDYCVLLLLNLCVG